MKQLLLSERWRPKKLEDTILLPRIHKLFENGLDKNIILYGTYGTGKTSLARILIGKYSKETPFMEINGSIETSIDVLRSKIDDFCSKVYIGLDLENTINKNTMKYVLIDESDRISNNFQDALKAYIEEYSTKNVRFILVTNHINKISDGIKSRFLSINFDPKNAEEEKYLKTQIFNKIKNVILEKEGIVIEKEKIAGIINKRFPDMRSIIISLENLIQTGSSEETSNIDNKIKSRLYSIIHDKTITYDDIYHFLMDNFGADNIHQMISLFGHEFIKHSINIDRNNIDKLFQVNYIISDYSNKLETNTDPIVLGMTIIGKIRDLF